MKKKNIDKQRVAYAIVLGVLACIYFLVYINKTFPFQEGWYTNYDALIRNGKIPYKDFYYYLPPLNLLIDHVLLFLANNVFIIYKIFRLVERLFLIECMYFMLTKYYKPQIVWFCCLVGGIMGASQSFELMGDYNQTGQLLFVLLMYCAARFAEETENKHQNMFLVLCGFIIGLQFTLKQTYFVAACIVYFLILVITCVLQRNKRFWTYCISTMIGIVIPIGICFAWVLSHNMLSEFMKQVFFTGSKGSISEILVNSILVLFRNNLSYVCLALLLALVFYHLWIQKKYNNRQEIIHIGIEVLALISIWGYILYACFKSMVKIYLQTKFIFVIVLSILAICVISYYGKAKNSKYYDMVTNAMIVVTCFIGGVIMVKDVNYISYDLHFSTNAFSFSGTGAAVLSCFLIIIYLIYMLISYKEKNLPLIMIYAGAVAVCYSSLMTAKDYIVSSTCWITIPLLLAVFLCKKVKFNQMKNILCIFVCMIEMTSCLAQKVSCTYNWWGWVDEPISVKTETIDNELLKGYKFSEKEKNLYEKTIKVIEENTDENSTVLGFPHLAIFNILTNHVENTWFVPILFYDVCSDEYAEKANKLLEKNPPDIVIWCDMPGCMETHEAIFRAGQRLGQRDIQDWFSNEVADKSYVLVGQVENLFIYKLDNNGIESNYTYFQDPDKKNETVLER